MGILKTNHVVSDEEREYQKENLLRLENEFDMTKAMGVKKHPDAMQFIFDKNRECFVVVPGPEENFKLKNPYVVDFKQVKDVYMEVEEYWTKSQNKFDEIRSNRTLLQGDFDKVFWRYNLNLVIVTNHPYAKTIRYQMNYKTIITRVANGIFVHRGLELNGTFRGAELKEESERIAKFAQDQKKCVGVARILNLDDDDNKKERDGIEGLLVGAAERYFDEKFVKRMENVSRHLDRAYRISKVLGKA